MAVEERLSLYRRLLDRYGAGGEALYVLLAGFLALTVNGFAAYLTKQPLLFPSLSPTVFTIFRQPLSKDSSPRNTITGHFVAIAVGFAALYAFGLVHHPSVLGEGVTLARIGAASSSAAVAEALMVLVRRPHIPAGTTTLLVSLGLFTTPSQLGSLAAGIVLVTVVCWIFNRSLGVPVPLWSPRQDAEKVGSYVPRHESLPPIDAHRREKRR